jgi:hypothetical protein
MFTLGNVRVRDGKTLKLKLFHCGGYRIVAKAVKTPT